MQIIHVYPLPSFAEASFVENGTAVVIDVLRATSVVAYAVHAGVREIFPVLEIDEAFRLKTEIEQKFPDSVLLGGERKGLPIEGFDLGNSPQRYTPDRVKGKTLVFTTTNGTVAMHAARPAKEIYTAAFVNAAAVVEAITEKSRISIFCAGTDGVETEEDVLLAGCLVDRLYHNGVTLNDGAEAARKFWAAEEENLSEALRRSRGGRNLTALGLDADISAAARLDAMDVVPRLDPKTMRISPWHR